MSFFEPRLKPLPDAFYSDGDASPVRSNILRRSPSWSGYVPYKLLEMSDGDCEAQTDFDEDPTVPEWPSTDDEFETDDGQEKTTETEIWKADPKISMETQIQARNAEPAVKEASPKVQVNLAAALSPSTSPGPFLSMLPLEHRRLRSEHTLDDCNSFLPEKLRSFTGGVLNSFVCPQYATQHHMLQQKQNEIKAANYEAAQKNRNGYEKHGTPNGTPGPSKEVGLQQPAGTTAKPFPTLLENERTAKAMKIGDAAKKKARELGKERAKERAMMPAVDHMKPRHVQQLAP